MTHFSSQCFCSAGSDEGRDDGQDQVPEARPLPRQGGVGTVRLLRGPELPPHEPHELLLKRRAVWDLHYTPRNRVPQILDPSRPPAQKGRKYSRGPYAHEVLVICSRPRDHHSQT